MNRWPPKRVSKQEIAERRAHVLAMRAEGLGWTQIGKALGITPQHAFLDHQRAIKENEA